MGGSFEAVGGNKLMLLALKMGNARQVYQEGCPMCAVAGDHLESGDNMFGTLVSDQEFGWVRPLVRNLMVV